MALASSGSLRIGGTVANRSIEQEINGATFSSPYTTLTSLNATPLRNLAGVASGKISMNDFYGKSAALWSGTITQGYADVFTERWSGFFNAFFGSISPTTLSDGKTINDWHDTNSGPACTLVIGGFSSNPTQNGYFNYAQVGSNGIVYASTADYYVYDSGAQTVQWSWLYSATTFGFATSGNVSGTIV